MHIFQNVKENISHDETKYIKRRVANILKEALNRFSVAVLTGARQVGKSTLLLNEFKEFAYFTMDDFDVVETLKADPLFIFSKYDKVIVDEAQKFPEVLNSVKLIVDRYKNKKIILSGSSNLLLMKSVTESLAGRAFYCELLPMSYGEFKGKTTINNFLNLWKKILPKNVPQEKIDIKELLLKGFMPANLLSKKDHVLWFDSYVKTYLERDLRELSQIDSLIDFRKLMQALALRVGNILKQSEISRDLSISSPTTSRYIKLLEVSNIVERVYGFYRNKGKRLLKSPKIYFTDPGLAVFLSGYFDKDSLAASKEFGSFFENIVFFHLKSLCNLITPPANIYYFRDLTGKEVDFILEYGRKLLAIEVKATKDVSIKEAKNLIYFMDLYPETILGLILYQGDEIKQITSNIAAVPWWLIDF